MAHRITEIDKVVGLEKFWHGLNEIVKTINQQNSNQEWEIVGHDLIDATTGKSFRITDDDGKPVRWQRFVCSDMPDHTLHIGNSETFKPVQPSRFWDVLNGFCDDNKAKIVSAGSIKSRKVLFASVETNEGNGFEINKQKYHNYFNFVLGTDDKLSFTGFDSLIKCVCSNSVNASLASHHNFQFKIKKTAGSEARIQDMESFLESLFEERESVAMTLRRMAEQPATLNEAERIFVGLLARPDEKPSKQTLNMATRLSDAFQNSPGNKGETREDVFNSCSYVWTHGNQESKNFDPWKQFTSSEFGGYARKKAEAFRVCASDDLYARTLKTGDEILSDLLAGVHHVATPISELEGKEEFAKLLEN